MAADQPIGALSANEGRMALGPKSEEIFHISFDISHLSLENPQLYRLVAPASKVTEIPISIRP
jgi:hypothetical protein